MRRRSQRRRSRPTALLIGLVLVGCGPQPESAEAPGAAAPGPALASLDDVPRPLMLAANRGRDVIGSDGQFSLPEGVTRVWIDVGAHRLETTREEFLASPDMALVAIEPLRECWDHWPESPRLIGLPIAINIDRGWQDFHVNAEQVTSSLAETIPGSSIDNLVKTVEVRPVPVLRLEDVLARIPPRVALDYLKTDVQGLDLQVLRSAGEQLRRVRKVRTEVINEPIYRGIGGEHPGHEDEFRSYMDRMGFRHLRDLDVKQGRKWLDMEFVNGVLEPATGGSGRR